VILDGRIRVHLTNVDGVGAIQLALSLLPAIEKVPGLRLEQIFVPDRGPMSRYKTESIETTITKYSRYLPKALSRFLECTFLGKAFEGPTPLLVLGDLPLRCRSEQTVFVQTPHLISGSSFSLGEIRYIIARAIFRMNLHFVKSFIVQTEWMKQQLEWVYPQLAGKVYVVAQPVPLWVLKSGLKRSKRAHDITAPLQLFYPAAGYPHKNHILFRGISELEFRECHIGRVTLTISPERNPNPNLPWLDCIGHLEPDQVLNAYSSCDALLFLSTAESYGFPLIEAMWIGLPIVCADLPYARVICGNKAIYFDPYRPESLKVALLDLQDRLRRGWWPNWTEQLRTVPTQWEKVAAEVARIATKGC
jgi:hypothetical protein